MELKSPHWPGVGKYIGEVNDSNGVMVGFNHLSKPIYHIQDTQEFQRRRVYQDELDFLNGTKA